MTGFKALILVIIAATLTEAQRQPQRQTVRGPGVRIPNSQNTGSRVPVPVNVITGSSSSGGMRFDTGSVNRSPSQPGRPGPASTPTCATAGRSIVSQCFQSNGGFQMQYVINLLSNGTQGQRATNPTQMRRNLCNSQGNIIACVFTGVNSLRNSQQCPTTTSFVRLEQETVNLVSELQQTCGSGPLPPPSPCLRELSANLKQCYNKVGLSPALFVPSDSQLVGAIIGANKDVARKFCRVKTRLFDCMKQTMDRCQGSTEVMALGGYDQESLRKGVDVLCKDVNLYVSGLECFQKPTDQVTGCANNKIQQITHLKAQRIQTSMPADQFYKRYCQIRVQHLECTIAAWKKKCKTAEVGLKNEFECNLLPTSCQNEPVFQSRLRQTCSVSSFQRQFRNGGSSSRTTSGIVMTLVTVALIVLL